MKTYRLSARIDEETFVKLERRARMDGKDESAVVREALAAYLSEPAESAYDALRRLGGLGAVKGTPPDLSTNAKYFEGLGRSEQKRPARYRSAGRASRSR